MFSYEIGVNGLQIAQQAIELIGSNIANAGTEGYHRQELRLSPIEVGAAGQNVLMAGPTVREIHRMIDMLLEREITRQRPTLGQVEQELLTLQSIEGALGQVGSEALTTAMNYFFNSLTELTNDPTSQPLLIQAIDAADSLAIQFRNLASFLIDLRNHTKTAAQTIIEQVNALTAEITQLNSEIHMIAVRNGNTNMLKDRRDQALNELAQLIDARVETEDIGLGLINVTAWGTSLVLGNHNIELEVAITFENKLGVSVKGANYYQTNLQGGKLGGLLAIRNEILPDLLDRLDLLARQVIDRINGLHVQGLGPAGSFSELRGVQVSGATLDSWDADIQAGKFYIRLLDASGTATVYDVDVDPATDTVTSIRDKLNALDPAHLRAEVAGSVLRIEGLDNWKFDFVPVITVDTSGLSGSAQPTVAGLYAGQATDTFTCTVVGTGQVGVTDGLRIEVRNGAAELVKTLNVGADANYAAGDFVELGDGLRMALSTGTLNNGETFTIQAIANSDETGFLSAAGMNTFFSGNSATSIAVRDEIKADPNRLATARRADGTGNDNIVGIAEVGRASLSVLGNVTIPEFYRQLVLKVGHGTAIRQARQKSIAHMLHQLENQREDVSGVDINEEVAKLLAFERMFQAMARFLSTQNYAMKFLIEQV